MKDLYTGEEINTWTDSFEDGEEFVETIIFFNGVSINMPKETFKAVVRELDLTVKLLELSEQNDIKLAE